MILDIFSNWGQFCQKVQRQRRMWH